MFIKQVRYISVSGSARRCINRAPTQYCRLPLNYSFVWQWEKLQYCSLRRFFRGFGCIDPLIEAIHSNFVGMKPFFHQNTCLLIDCMTYSNYNNKNQLATLSPIWPAWYSDQIDFNQFLYCVARSHFNHSDAVRLELIPLRLPPSHFTEFLSNLNRLLTAYRVHHDFQ